MPEIPSDEQDILAEWKKLRRIKIRCQHNEIKQWTRNCFPTIVLFFKRYGIQPKNVQIAIETLMREENEFAQYSMNIKMKKENLN
tara:strand:+ start:365 stop:619 length:255 start_codon:yes stop_codon:yes gene_type:complete